MLPLTEVLAVGTALASAMALFAGARNGRLQLPAGSRRTVRLAGAVLAFASLALWVRALGAGAGLCAMLGTWMLAMMLLPWLALAAVPANVLPQARD